MKNSPRNNGRLPSHLSGATTGRALPPALHVSDFGALTAGPLKINWSGSLKWTQPLVLRPMWHLDHVTQYGHGNVIFRKVSATSMVGNGHPLMP
jgi:hypothetical protein